MRSNIILNSTNSIIPIREAPSPAANLASRASPSPSFHLIGRGQEGTYLEEEIEQLRGENSRLKTPLEIFQSSYKQAEETRHNLTFQRTSLKGWKKKMVEAQEEAQNHPDNLYLNLITLAGELSAENQLRETEQLHSA